MGGGNSKNGSGLFGRLHIYGPQVQKKLKRNPDDQRTQDCHKVRRNLREGDLVFFHNGRKNGCSHVGIYLKNNKFIHASTSRGVNQQPE